jgi:hypothetical protein
VPLRNYWAVIKICVPSSHLCLFNPCHAKYKCTCSTFNADTMWEISKNVVNMVADLVRFCASSWRVLVRPVVAMSHCGSVQIE